MDPRLHDAYKPEFTFHRLKLEIVLLKEYLLVCTAPRCQRAYILPLWLFLSFFFLFFRRLISEVIEQISTKLGHLSSSSSSSLVYDCYLKNLVRTHVPLRAEGGGAKSLFWDWVWTLTEPNLQLNMISKIGKKTCQSIGTPLHTSQIWWFLVQKRLRTVGEFLPTPVPFKFLALGDTASLIVWTL